MQFLSRLLIFGSILIAVDAEHNIKKRDTTNQKKVVCYYTNWSVYRPGTAKFSPQNINPYLCTHLIYAFGGLDKENGLRPYDKYQDIEQGGYAKFNGLKTYNKNLKTLLAIGGWNEGSARFSKLVDDPDKRKEFVKNVIKFLRQNNFDGIDLDWEYPAYRDGSNPSDKENYAFLVKELRDEFNRESSKTGRPRLLLTMAVPAGIEYIDKGYDVPELNKHLDFINLLTYDYHSSYEPAVNHHSPLYPLEEDSEYNFEAKLNIDHTIKHYIAAGADKDKLILGIPTYGRSYTLFNKESTDIGAPSDGPGEKGEATREKGYLAYYEICGNFKKDDKWTVEQPKPRAMGPYAYKENQWVGYDDEEFVKLKAKYVKENDLGGIMFWSIDNDDFRGNCHSKPYPLIEAGKEALFGDSKNEQSQEKETKATLKSRPKPRPNSKTTTSAPKDNAVAFTTTPEPPTTPDTGTDFTCKDEGFFPHPRECKKYFWCLDSGPSNLGIVAHQFTCPSGLVFNKVSDSCDYSRNVICKDKKTSTETTTTTTTTPKPTKSGIKTTTTTTSTTTTTTHIPEVQEEVEDELEEEDPKEIKQLIDLIKKLGGIAELEKQLNIKDGSTEVTTPAISKSLYNKVLKIPSNKYQSSYINGPGPQSEGLDYKDENVNYKKDKPQYVTIRRQRPSKDVADNTKEEEEEDTPNIDTSTERFKPKYKTFERTRYRDLGEVADETSENDSLPKYTTISRTRSTESEPEETTSPKYVTLHRQRPVYREEESNEEESSSVSTTASTLQTPRYVSLLRQRSTTTTTLPLDDSLIETTTRDTIEEPKEKKTNKVSNEVFTTEQNKISTNLSDNEPLITEIITTTVNMPTYAILKNSEATSISTTTVSEQKSGILSTTIVPTLNVQNDSYALRTKKISTSTITNVVTSVYEAATERQRVRVKNIQNFLLEHKKTEPITQLSIAQVTTNSPTTIENVIATKEPTQKSILKGRFGGSAHIRLTLRKPTGTSEKIPETTTEEKIGTTTEKQLRSYKYVNRFIRPAKNSTERAIMSTTSRRLIRPTTESASELNTRQFIRFRSTTTKANNYDDNSAPFTRRNSSRFRSSTTEKPSTTVSEIPKSRFFRNRRPFSSTPIATEATSVKELLNLEENAEHVRYETIPYVPTTNQIPVTNFEEASVNEGEVQITTFESLEPTNYDTNETTTNQPTTSKIFRGSVRANSLLTEDDPSKKSRTSSSGRHNSRFLKDEQKILFIRISPPPGGSGQSDFTSPSLRNVTRNRGKIRAFDSLELNTLNDGLTNDDRPNDLFRGSETKFRIRQSTIKPITAATSNEIGPSTAEEIQRDRTRHRIARPVQRTTTTITEESIPISTTESHASKANRRRKFRPEYKSTTTLSYEEETTTSRLRNPERKFRSRTTVLKSPIVTSSTTETLEENDKNIFSSSSTPYYDDSSLFGKTRDDRKIGGSAEDLANTAVVAINTLAKAPPSNNEFRSSTRSSQQGVVRGETTQKRVVEYNDFKTRGAPHAKGTVAYDDFQVRQPANQPLLQPASQPALARSPEPVVDRLPVSFQPAPFQPAPFQPSPFQTGPFQPLPYPALPSFQTANDGAFAPAQPLVHRLQQAQQQVATTAHPQATSRQTFVLRRGPPPVTRTTPLLQPAARTTTAVPPQYLNDNAREQFADYSEQAPPPLDQRVALKGKVRIHGDGYIECLDVGSFPHPFSCQKFISCAKTEYGSLFGWEYTCPKGLAFDPVGGICNWSAGPACNNNNN